ncbi:hypothetical protein KIPB_009597, partial [Kipferlia bialata]
VLAKQGAAASRVYVAQQLDNLKKIHDQLKNQYMETMTKLVAIQKQHNIKIVNQ